MDVGERGVGCDGGCCGGDVGGTRCEEEGHYNERRRVSLPLSAWQGRNNQSLVDCGSLRGSAHYNQHKVYYYNDGPTPMICATKVPAFSRPDDIRIAGNTSRLLGRPGALVWTCS